MGKYRDMNKSNYKALIDIYKQIREYPNVLGCEKGLYCLNLMTYQVDVKRF